MWTDFRKVRSKGWDSHTALSKRFRFALAAWVLLPPNPDFRWLLEREDSPWYAALRLFRRSFAPDGRQRQAEAVLQALQDLLASRR